MFELFDRAWTNIHKLILVDSYQRFRNTAEFEALWKIWNQTPRSGARADLVGGHHPNEQGSTAMFQKTTSWHWIGVKGKSDGNDRGAEEPLEEKEGSDTDTGSSTVSSSESTDGQSVEMALSQLSAKSDIRQSFKGGTLAANGVDEQIESEALKAED